MSTSSNLRQLVRKICERTLEGKLSFDDFHNEWPKEARNSLLWDQIFRDAEDVMEHLPEGPGQESLDMYCLLHLDIKLLSLDVSDEDLLAVKEKIKKDMKPLSVDKIESALRAFKTDFSGNR